MLTKTYMYMCTVSYLLDLNILLPLHHEHPLLHLHNHSTIQSTVTHGHVMFNYNNNQRLTFQTIWTDYTNNNRLVYLNFLNG